MRTLCRGRARQRSLWRRSDECAFTSGGVSVRFAGWSAGDLPDAGDASFAGAGDVVVQATGDNTLRELSCDVDLFAEAFASALLQRVCVLQDVGRSGR